MLFAICYSSFRGVLGAMIQAVYLFEQRCMIIWSDAVSRMDEEVEWRWKGERLPQAAIHDGGGGSAAKQKEGHEMIAKQNF